MIWISLLSNWSRWMGGSRACKHGGIEVMNTGMRGSQGFDGERSWETWGRDSEDRRIISTNDREAPNRATTVYHRPSTSHIRRRQSRSLHQKSRTMSFVITQPPQPLPSMSWHSFQVPILTIAPPVKPPSHIPSMMATNTNR
jgi:hypothetical protein